MRRLVLTPPGAKQHTHTMRVLYIDTDRANVVHHSVYLRYLEAARIEFMRTYGLDYAAFERETGLGLPVVDAHLAFRAPARFDDVLEITTWTAVATRARLVFHARIKKGDVVLHESAITLACVDMSKGEITSIPERVREACT